jgi:hypothetical protein
LENSDSLELTGVCGWDWSRFANDLIGRSDDSPCKVPMKTFLPLIACEQLIRENDFFIELEKHSALVEEDLEDYWEELTGNKESSLVLELLDDTERYSRIGDPKIAKAVRRADLEFVKELQEKDKEKKYKYQLWLNDLRTSLKGSKYGWSLLEMFDNPYQIMYVGTELVPLLRIVKENFGEDYNLNVYAG